VTLGYVKDIFVVVVILLFFLRNLTLEEVMEIIYVAGTLF
jgi:hypothetical protein